MEDWEWEECTSPSTSGTQEGNGAGPSTSGIQEGDGAGPSTSGIQEGDSAGPSTSGIQEDDGAGQSTSGIQEGDSAGPSTSGIQEDDSAGSSTSGIKEDDAAGSSTSGIQEGDGDKSQDCSSEIKASGAIFNGRGRALSVVSRINPKTSLRPLRKEPLPLAAIPRIGHWKAQPEVAEKKPEVAEERTLAVEENSSFEEEVPRGRFLTLDDDNGLEEQRSTYVPAEPTKDEEELFGDSISSEINFDKYDGIKVSVSGENPPQPIHTFQEAGLSQFMLNVINNCKYSKPTPIQKYSIPVIMSGRDLMACAQTGSGKTTAFLIAIINILLENNIELDLSGPCKPQALIITPRRELTIQLFNEARKFSRGTNIKVAISYGGTEVAYQLNNLMKGCHILIATPSLLLDFLRRQKIDLSQIRYLVFDEADIMLDLGFRKIMEALLNHNTMVRAGDKTTLMFSATFQEEVEQLASKFLNNYLFVAVGMVGAGCSDVDQKFFSVSKCDKIHKLEELVRNEGSAKCLVFVERKRTTDILAIILSEKGFPATSIHGGRRQQEREEALADFKSGRMNILIATFVALKGVEIRNVAHVVNYDLPKKIDEYVNRIGKTNRVGNRGLATSFYDPDRDRALAGDLVKILQQAGQPVPDFLKNEGSDA